MTPREAAWRGVALGMSFTVGWFLHRPRVQQVEHERIVYRDRTVTAEAVTSNISNVALVQGPERIVWRKLDCATGKPSEERIVERGPARVEAATIRESRTVATEHEATRVSERLVIKQVEHDWHAAALVGWHGAAVYGVSVARRVLWNFDVGAWGTTERTAGLSLGMRW